MTVDFAGIESVVALVGAGAVGGALALRVAHPRPLLAGRSLPELARSVAPLAVAAVAALALGAYVSGAARGLSFNQGFLVGLAAAAVVVVLAPTYEPVGPELATSELRADRAWSGVGASGVALLAVLATLLVTGSGPAGLFGLAAGAGAILLLGEPTSRFDTRIRFVGFVATLAAATAFVPSNPVFRSIVPDSLLMPLLFGAAATFAAATGVAVDRIHGPYHWGVAAAGIAAVVAASAAVGNWSWDLGLALAVTAGWLGAGTTLYAIRFAVYETGQADALGRAGPALGVIGSISRGLQSAGLMILGVAGVALIADAAVLTFAPDGTFGILLAGVGATGAALGLGGVQVGTGPGGGPRHIPEAFDSVALAWAPLVAVFALVGVLPSVIGVPGPVLDSRLTLGVPGTLVGLVLGAIVPFYLAAAGVPNGDATRERLRRGAVAAVPVAVVVSAAVALGPAALVGAVLGAALTGIPLGVFWAAAREATASMQARLPASSPTRRALAEALDEATGWRLAAAVLAVAVAGLAVAVLFVPTATFLGA